MKKASKLMGILLLAAGMSFAISSCEKEFSGATPEEETKEESVDFNDVTKGMTQEISRARANIKEALNKLQVDLFDIFTYYGESHDLGFTLRSEKFYKFLLEVDMDNNKLGDDNTNNYLSISCKDRVLSLETKEGYFLRIELPSWMADLYEKDGKFGFDTDRFYNCIYALEIGKGDVVYAKNVLDTGKNTSTFEIYDLEDNGTAIAGFNLAYGDKQPASCELWYDDAENRGDSKVAGTNVSASNPDEVISSLSRIDGKSQYSEEEAERIAEAFNTNVKAHNPECTIAIEDLKTPAIVEGSPLYAKVKKGKVVIMHGEKQVTINSLIDFVSSLRIGFKSRKNGSMENVTLLGNNDISDLFSQQLDFFIDEDSKYSEYINEIRKMYEQETEPTECIASISMIYESTGPDGRPIALSGNMYVPCLASDEDTTFLPVKDVVVNLFGTSTQGEGMLSTVTPYLYTYCYLASDSLAVFEPEYIGFGESSEYLQTYLCHNLIAQNCCDMLVEGIELLQDDYCIKFKDGWGTYVTGYSQGGGNAMALTRHLTIKADEYTKKLVNLKESYCGAGPYSPLLTFDTWVENDGMSMSLILPMVLYGMNEVHSDVFAGENLKDYFYKDYWATGIPLKVKYRQYGYKASLEYDLEHQKEDGRSGLLGPEVSLKYITSSEVLTKGSRKYDNLQEVLGREIVCEDWTPEKPITLFADENDNVVPYENTKYAYEVLYKKAPEMVKKPVLCDTGDHVLAMLVYNAFICEKFLGSEED